MTHLLQESIYSPFIIKGAQMTKSDSVIYIATV